MATLGQPVLIHEAWVDFALELSVITARNPRGEVASYVPVENRHRHHILDVTIAPAAIPAEVAAEAVAMAERIAPALELEGLLAVEMFLDPRRPAPGQRAGAAAAQFGPLDDRRLRGQPVRAAGARGLRPAAGRSARGSPMPR